MIDTLTKAMVKLRRKHVSLSLFERAGGRVLHGPFAGLQLTRKVHCGRGAMAAKVFGLYESELLNEINAMKDLTYLVNLGAGDGYYPIGMLLAGQIKHAYCYEADPLGQQNIKENARLNQVGDQVTVFGRAETDFFRCLPDEVFRAHSLILCDVEGGEFEIFEPDCIDRFRNATFLIELHDFGANADRSKREQLVAKFASQFEVRILKSGPKDWSGIAEIESLSDNDRALVCTEGRKVLGEWLICTPRR